MTSFECFSRHFVYRNSVAFVASLVEDERRYLVWYAEKVATAEVSKGWVSLLASKYYLAFSTDTPGDLIVT